MPTSSNARSAARALSILLFLAGRARPTPAVMVAEGLDLPRSSTYHLLNVLRSYNFVVYYAAEHAWGLGPAVFELGSAYLRSEPLERIGGPVLADLAEQTSKTAHLGILEGSEILILGKKDPPGNVYTFVTRAGVRLPAHLTSLGRAILMELPPSQLRALYSSPAPLVRRTTRGPLVLAQLERELDEARARGYAVEDSLTTMGVTCIGAPVYSHERRPMAAVSISFISVQHQREEWDELASHVREAAARMSRALGWKGEAPEPSADRLDVGRPAGVAS